MKEISLSVHSETGVLETVLVHTPGIEMNLVSPETREDLLFEDILFLSLGCQPILALTIVSHGICINLGKRHFFSQIFLRIGSRQDTFGH